MFLFELLQPSNSFLSVTETKFDDCQVEGNARRLLLQRLQLRQDLERLPCVSRARIRVAHRSQFEIPVKLSFRLKLFYCLRVLALLQINGTEAAMGYGKLRIHLKHGFELLRRLFELSHLRKRT